MFTGNHVLDELKRDYPYTDNILQKLIQMLEFYAGIHGKALVVRFDLKYPEGYREVYFNDSIMKFSAYIVQFYKNQGYDPCYMWVREQETSLHPHYHFLILLNGNKVRSYHYVFETAKSFWGNILGVSPLGLVDHCTKGKDGTFHENGILLVRSNGNYCERCSDVLRQVSYMAKFDGKGDYLDGLRNFGMSRLHRR
ncbi:YagK/YfjJ domain-containing protein [Desulfovibrio sp. TomC]|uniref:YagK/YfjJ domain-containing protein n=1 Tax=Desulfovibrio sp. TomC TaxID=1562888 RepID=UPI0009E48026|nr:inovirus-type Gp2 protein [Desulfovibrio sp. TomC]